MMFVLAYLFGRATRDDQPSNRSAFAEAADAIWELTVGLLLFIAFCAVGFFILLGYAYLVGA